MTYDEWISEHGSKVDVEWERICGGAGSPVLCRWAGHWGQRLCLWC
jgi:hypothetical protein